MGYGLNKGIDKENINQNLIIMLHIM